jgi:glycosyltransferase involved in cell wall biosynthesis
MKVSVLLVTYNHERFISQAIESVLAQKAEFPFELVIGEDCSTDSTREIVSSYQAQYPTTIRAFFRDRNIGLGENFFRALSECRGEYIALLEGDDYWTSPDKLSMQVRFLDEHPDCSLCGHKVSVLCHDGLKAPEFTPSHGKAELTTRDILAGYAMHTDSAMFRARLIQGFPIPDCMYRAISVDRPLFMLLAERGRVIVLDAVMATYRVHSHGAWSGLHEIKRDRFCIDMWKQMDEHFNHKYHDAVSKQISRNYDNIAFCMRQEGHYWRAFLSYLSSMRHGGSPWKNMVGIAKLLPHRLLRPWLNSMPAYSPLSN